MKSGGGDGVMQNVMVKQTMFVKNEIKRMCRWIVTVPLIYDIDKSA